MSNTRTLAFDRKTVRSKDANGFLHVALSNISKGTVDPYYGYEIPNFVALGLEKNRVYYLLRDPEELAKGAATFNNLPILAEHVAISSEVPNRDLWIGSTGTDAEFVAPYLQNSAVIWSQPDIDDIESETKRQWSCAYRYLADMTPGNYLGLRFDGIMREITGNHVALVETGRAGPDVIVGDSLGNHKMLRSALLTSTAASIVAMVAPLLAQDKALDPEELAKLLDPLALDAEAKPEAKPAKVAADDDKPTPAEGEEGDDDKPKKKKKPAIAADGDGDDEPMNKPAMDAAIAAARADTVKEMNAIRVAEKDVFPHVGELAVAMDSAADVYKFALDQAKVSTEGVHPSAFKSMVAMLPLPDAATPKPLAMDASNADADFRKRFPDAMSLVRS